MTITDWLWILHPALAVVLIYPLIGMVVRLAWQTRQRRVAQVKHPPVVAVITVIWAVGSRRVWCFWC